MLQLACGREESVGLGSLEVRVVRAVSIEILTRVTRLAAFLDSMFSAKSVLRLLFLFAFLLSSAAADTQITLPSFSPESNGDFFTFGDTAYNLANRSYILNEGARTPDSKGSCGMMAYGKPFHIRNAATGREGSFSTSFSFTFTTHGLPWDNIDNPMDGSGLAFVFLQNAPMATMRDVVSQLGKFGACTSSRYQTLGQATAPSGFSVQFDTDYSPIHHKEPSNNFIRVGRNLAYEYDIEAYTHNLCGNDTHCTYFSNGRTFTAWIDYTSSSQTLEVRMANGSNAKPLQPLLRITNYKFPKSLEGEVLVTFWGSSDVNHREEHELLSWSFFSTETSESKLRVMLHHWKSSVGLGVTTGAVVIGTVAALVILWSIYSFATPSSSYSALDYSAGPHVFSYKELRKATGNFGDRNLLGRGGSGLVYKGCLEGGILVAVKQINMAESEQAKSLFHAEVTSLGQIRHRNVVHLYGWCQEKGKLLLVYEYMSNGTLHQWLHENCSQQVLSLKMRHSILAGVGAALEYLHEDCSTCILHRDIKSSNVLLDSDFKAYVGDFGLSRLIDHHKLDKTTLAAGTFGYMAPELPYTSKATKESDVYSFGILILEVVCGRHPLDLETIEPEDLVLLFIVWRAHEDGSLFKLMDPRMIVKAFQPSSGSIPFLDETTHITQVPPSPSNSSNLTWNTMPKSLDMDANLKSQAAMVVSLLQLGLFCCLPNPKARPSMGEVNQLLKQIQDLEDIYPIKTISIPSLPTSKPPGIYHSLEYSQSVAFSSLVAPSLGSLV